MFLDRDGVINVDNHFIIRPDEVIFVDGLFEMCRYFRDKAFEIIIITNQSGIGRELFSEEDFRRLMAFILDKFRAEGVEILDYFYCPHLPSDLCMCRKPLPGMFHEAIQKYDLMPVNCLSIGDRETDFLAAVHAGIQDNYLLVKNELDIKHSTRPIQVRNLQEIVEIHRRFPS